MSERGYKRFPSLGVMPKSDQLGKSVKPLSGDRIVMEVASAYREIDRLEKENERLRMRIKELCGDGEGVGNDEVRTGTDV